MYAVCVSVCRGYMHVKAVAVVVRDVRFLESRIKDCYELPDMVDENRTWFSSRAVHILNH